MAARPCRFKSCFPHSLQHKDLRQSVVSPFLFLAAESDTNLTQNWACVGFVLVVGIRAPEYHEVGPERRPASGAERTVGVRFLGI